MKEAFRPNPIERGEKGMASQIRQETMDWAERASIEAFRPDPVVMLRILLALWLDNRDYFRTELGMSARISYDVLSKYLSYMAFKKMISVRMGEGGNQIVRITIFGVEVCEDLNEWVPKNSPCRVRLERLRTAITPDGLQSGLREESRTSIGPK
jgi:predicted transcriptional regulator